mmetsp:Transcript_20466/g.32762  ORF Transcript_20466/g.32762 Transcript_20466/m.32762 type:complete len:197 (+) Transcript_20466:44-634(+)|eukprot:CAMPEP_0202691196 /NCGR_PEP_ID=MMETSP1385-20130828/5980_1 /ASSEMBLY_ACC=CAM_ASM_000861 /TAXON_ID=933848 /ORGANISM="Elphidium margaritaceum" /LENGTH=196 /DNA_ID=CAMNT_0049346563 /DNA_START=29 /DNA_END=619 /DNA_ORIENTATION=-
MSAAVSQVNENEVDNADQIMDLAEIPVTYEAMDLKVYKHRKHNSYHHPKYMLNDDATDWYISATNPNFKVNEADWIVLSLQQKDALCVPLFGEIQCNGYVQDVKRMRIEIGNYDKNEWIALKQSNALFEFEQSNAPQRFEFDIDDENIVTISQLMQQKKFVHLKLTLVENHGAIEEVYSKFAIAKFKLFGITVGKY